MAVESHWLLGHKPRQDARTYSHAAMAGYVYTPLDTWLREDAHARGHSPHASARVRMTNRAGNSVMEVIKMQNRDTASAKVSGIKIQLASTFCATKVTASGT